MVSRYSAIIVACIVVLVGAQQQPQQPQQPQQSQQPPQQPPQQQQQQQQQGGGGAAAATNINQGVCPRPNNPPNGLCNQDRLCQDDAQCGQGFKCCDTGCGGRVCRRVGQQGQQGQRPQGGQQGGPQGQQGGPNRGGPQGSRGPQDPRNGGPPTNSRLNSVQRNLAPQPSLVGLGGCSRGATLRNPDGSTLVCGFGPRDFACPEDFSCVFDSVLKSLICCPSDDATVPPTPKPSNPCADGEPVRDEFNKPLQCNNDATTGASTCPSGTLCTRNACCRPQSVAGFLSVKPGQCPLPLPVAQTGPCTNECSFDAECAGPLKCCFVGCGARCVKVAEPTPAPVDVTPAAGSPPGSNPALQGGPQGLQNPQQAQFELVPTRNDGIFLQQSRQGGFLGDQQGGGFGGQRGGPNGGQQQQQQQQFGNPQQQQFGGPRGGFQQQQQQQPQFGNGPQFRNRAQDFASKNDVVLKGTLFRPGVAPVTSNDTCANLSCPECHQCSEASGLPQCLRMPDCCPDKDTVPTVCLSNPCPHQKCPDNPEAFCFPDPCGPTCRVVYLDRLGNLASCPTSSGLKL